MTKKSSSERVKKWQREHNIKQLRLSANMHDDVDALKDKIVKIKANFPDQKLTSNFAAVEFAVNKLIAEL